MTFMESDTIVDLSSIVMVHRRIWSNEKWDNLFCSMMITIVLLMQSYGCLFGNERTCASINAIAFY